MEMIEQEGCDVFLGDVLLARQAQPSFNVASCRSGSARVLG